MTVDALCDDDVVVAWRGSEVVEGSVRWGLRHGLHRELSILVGLVWNELCITWVCRILNSGKFSREGTTFSWTFRS